MLSADLFHPRQGMSAVAFLMLWLAMLSFPFSVAATNIFLGLLLAIALFSGLWWRGVIKLWHDFRPLFIALLLYLVLVVVGLLWSLDPEWGRRIVARHWFWLLLPVVVIVLSSSRHRESFLIAVSIGLSANLIYCVLQANGIIDSPSVAGSTIDNATGHIGHTSFGFIYGIWAAWLIHAGLLYQQRLRWLLWGLAGWSFVMVFMVEGKSGYIITAVLMFFTIIKWLREGGSRGMMISFVVAVMLLGVFTVSGPAKDRVLGAWDALTGSVKHDLSYSEANAAASVQARLEWWRMSLQIWQERPLFGSGTGSFPEAAKAWQSDPQHSLTFGGGRLLAHPHNQYLLSMVRWGIVGLIIMLSLLAVWIYRGVMMSWRQSLSGPLIALSGGALLVHGLSSASLEEHFSTIFAVLMLGAGLSGAMKRKNQL